MTSLLALGKPAAATAGPTTPPPSNHASVAELYRAIWRFAAGARKQYIAALAMLGGSTVVKLALPVLAGSAINAIQAGGDDSLQQALLLIAATIGVLAVSWALHGPGRIMERNVGLVVRAAMSDALYSKLASLPLAWHESQHSGEIQQRAQTASRALYDFSQNQFIYLQNAVNLIGPLVALILLSTTTGIVAIVGYLVVATVIVSFDRAIRRHISAEIVEERRYVAGLLDFLGNISTVISLRLTEASRSLIAQRLRRVSGPLRRSILLNEGKWCSVDMLSATLSWGLVVVYAWQAHSAGAAGGALMIGSVFMVHQYAQQAAGVIGSLALHFQGFARAQTEVSSVNMIWNAESRQPSSVNVAPDWKHIDVRGLNFTRPNGSSHGGIRDLSLSIQRGERIALIGPSGSGKSTLMRCIAGLYEPQHGFYSVDGEMLFGGRHLGSIATLIPQEAEVFEASVRDNLTFGAERPDDVLARAAYLSVFDAVLETMPEGFDSLITERGANLSGGQRQRLALTRGLLAAGAGEPGGSSIILMDEPTSALDQVTEARFFSRLGECLPDTTLIASVHRMSVLDHFDKVVLMEAGALVDCGTVAELYERQPLFRRMLSESESSEPTSPVQVAAAG